uniref:ADF-H domain-containing protein n=1 Tax=Chrysolophus pictus TaxID=9089 RepID=A0A8C3LY84_CHRPC
MATKIDKEACREAYNLVRDDATEVNWVTFKYNGSTIVPGDQGVDYETFKRKCTGAHICILSGLIFDVLSGVVPSTGMVLIVSAIAWEHLHRVDKQEEGLWQGAIADRAGLDAKNN